MKPEKSILLEFLPYGNLETLLKSDPELSINQKVRMAWDVSQGMCHLTKEKIIFRDLSLRNILLYREYDSGREFRAKLTDFGFATLANEKGQSSDPIVSGPWRIMAPETLQDSTNNVFSEKSDVWSFAVLLYCLITRSRPYAEIKDPKEVRTAILNGTRLTFDKSKFSDCECLFELFEQCMQDKPRKRPTFEQIEKQLAQLYKHLDQNQNQ